MSKNAKDATVTLEMLKGAFAMRAHAYAHIFDVLRETYGPDVAVDLLSQATVRMGKDMGAKFAQHSPADLEGLKNHFLGGIPCADDMFAPEVRRCDADRLEIKFHRCPLKDSWVAMGRTESDLELLCKAGGAIDSGLFTAAGFTFKGETWTRGQEGCCLLRIEPGEAA